jgi:hypothetical protein
VPRNIYLAYTADQMDDYDNDTLAAIRTASYSQLERIADGGDMYDTDISNKLLCLRCKVPGVACATVLSRFVAEKLLKAQAFANLDQKRKFLRLFTAIPQMGVARGWLFEAYVHDRFSSSDDIAEDITVYTLSPISNGSDEYRPNLSSATVDLLFTLRDRTVRVYTSPDDFGRRVCQCLL